MDHLSFYHLSSVYLYHLLTYPSMYLSTNHLYLYPSIYYLSTYLPTSLPISAVCHLSIIKKARENIQFRIQWGAYFKTCVVFPFLLVSKCSPVGEDFISLPREGLFLCGFGLGCGVPLTPPPHIPSSALTTASGASVKAQRVHSYPIGVLGTLC